MLLPAFLPVPDRGPTDVSHSLFHDVLSGFFVTYGSDSDRFCKKTAIPEVRD